MQAAVIGAGSWGTAITKILTDNGHTVNWWVHKPETAKYLVEYGHNPKYLQSVFFKKELLHISADLNEIISKSDLIIIATPAAFIQEAFSVCQANALNNKFVFTATKGMIPGLNIIPVYFFQQNLGAQEKNTGIICGPCHAEEVALERLSYLTVACNTVSIAEDVAALLKCRYIKTYVSNDVYGAELAAVLKNIYALGSGIFGGLGYGDNFQAVFVSNCSREMQTFIDAFHVSHRDVKESAYLGDLLVTAYSKFSRNRTFGYMIGQGYSVNAAQLEMQMIAEGYYAVKSIYELKKNMDVQTPIIDAVYRILYEKITPVIEMRILSDQLT
ncbi:MAG TPA: NAD(P)H-dependent glycerol-3-phosphate dehydrogenase [Flavobacteriales bacterium]|nr:NAD(P)H-dependent glycerol-3-phosphate dehydrogenase [Flavobacteriales bacterium]